MVVLEDMATLRSDQSAKQLLYEKGKIMLSFFLPFFGSFKATNLGVMGQSPINLNIY